MKDFDMMADKHPVLIDLMGIASQMVNSDGLKRIVVFDYIRNITEKLGIPAIVLKDFAEVMYLKPYEVMEEIA